MKTFCFRLLCLLFTLAMLAQLRASHLMGFDMSYECLGGCNYRITPVIYYDCCGGLTQAFLPLPSPNITNPVIPYPGQGTINFIGDPLGCNSQPSIATWRATQINDVTPICGNARSTCLTNPSSPSICGVMEVRYEATVNLCNPNASNPCNKFSITLSNSARNAVITSGARGNGLFTNSTVIDLGIRPCNSSPFFLEPPISFICLNANTTQTYNQAAVDPDGDSLVYRLIPCMSGANVPVAYNQGYDSLNPLGPDWLVLLDSITGDITFTPNPGSIEIGVICFEVLEYRNGVLIGTVVRDMQVQVRNSQCGVPPKLDGDNHTLGSVTLTPPSNTIIDACVGVELCFDIPVISPDTFNYTFSWNNTTLAGASLTDSKTGQPTPFTSAGSQNPEGRFCWTPTQQGRYTFTVRVKDDQCPLPGIQDLTFTINVGQPLARSTTVAFPGGCNKVMLCARPQSVLNYPGGAGFQYSWSGSGGINPGNPIIAPYLLDSCLFYVYPIGGIQSHTLMLTDTFGCSVSISNQVDVDTIPAEIKILPPNPTICLGESITLVATGAGEFLWSTNQAWGGNTITLTPQSDMWVSVTMRDSTCISTADSILITVLPAPVGSITGNTRLCDGESTILVATGGLDYQWSHPTGSGDSLTLSNLGSGQFGVWVIPDDGVCPGDTVHEVVTVWENPTADFEANIVCEGETTNFTDASMVNNSTLVNWEWNFADPNSGSQNTSSLEDPTHYFTSSGIFTVSLAVTSDKGCRNIATQNIRVNAMPKVDFSVHDVCEGSPHLFRNSSSITSGSQQFQWYLGDGNTTTTSSPTHQYQQIGSYVVTLISTSQEGCADSMTKTVLSHPNPVASFSIDRVCSGAEVSITNTSSVRGGLDRIDSWLWDFDDPGNSSASSTDEIPNYTYSAPGLASVNLRVTTENGCSHDTTIQTRVFEGPRADFYHENNCEKDEIKFFHSGVFSQTNPVNQWYWDFGNGQSSNQRNPVTNYRDIGAGLYEVTLAVVNTEECVDTIVKTIPINHNPQMRFAYRNICIGDQTQFWSKAEIDSTEDLPGYIGTYLWDFGGSGQGYGQGAEVPFTFDKPGIYTVRHTAISDSGCVSHLNRDIEVLDLPAVPDIIQDSVCFSNEATLLAGTPPGIDVHWFEDPNTQEPFHLGNSWVSPPLPYSSTWYLESVSEEGCRSPRIPINATVFEYADILLLPRSTLLDLPDGLLEIGAASTVTLNHWNWNMGDGSEYSLPSVSHEYRDPGLYEVVLRTIDKNGCDYIESVLIEVRKTVAAFFPSAFSPNDDGFNDAFSIGSHNLGGIQIGIYNRWGIEVFQSSRPDFRWYGKDKKGQSVPEGVYIYIASYTDVDGQRAEASGTITLIR